MSTAFYKSQFFCSLCNASKNDDQMQKLEFLGV